MKKYLILLLIMTIGLMSSAQTNAPKKHQKHLAAKKKVEKVVINNTNARTIVEIKNDKIYVNGEVVSSIKNAKIEDHKIVINHEGKRHEHRSGEKGWKEGQKEAKDNDQTSSERTNNDFVQTDKPFNRIEPNVRQSNVSHNALLGVYTDKSAPVNGAYISGVMQKSPAEKAGLSAEDVITKVNETPINSSDELVASIGTYRPGDNVIITYNRKGNEEQARIALGDKGTANENIELRQMSADNWRNSQQFPNNEGNNEREEMNNDRGNMYGGQSHFSGPHPVRLGISATDGRRPRGIYLDKVKPGSPAEAAGLQKGDIITRINGERVRYAYEMQELLSYPGIGNVIDIDYRHDGEKMRTEVHINDNRDENEQNYHRYRH